VRIKDEKNIVVVLCRSKLSGTLSK